MIGFYNCFLIFKPVSVIYNWLNLEIRAADRLLRSFHKHKLRLAYLNNLGDGRVKGAHFLREPVFSISYPEELSQLGFIRILIRDIPGILH
jgi:hypothetical protein